MPMISRVDIQEWASETCHDICNASDLKRICNARGFMLPKVKDKKAVADFVEMRLLESEGVHDALASVDEQALWALHTVRCASGSINAMELQSYFGFKRNAYSAPEYKTRFVRIQDALINKGLLLARDERGNYGSRFARIHVLLPPAVAEALSPLPVGSEPMDPLPVFRDWAEVAMTFLRADLLAQRGTVAENASLPWSSLFPVVSIENGALKVNGQERPAPEFVRAAIFKNWIGINSCKKQNAYFVQDSLTLDPNDESDYKSFAVKTDYVQPRGHILNNIAPGHGVRFDRLFEMFEIFQCAMATDVRAIFLESGEQLGFLTAVDVADQRFLVPNAHAWDEESASTFANWRDADKGVEAPISAVTLTELLTIARISTLSIKNGNVCATPSLKWIGREREHLESTAAIQALLQRSTLYRQTFNTVAEREGKWRVHDNVSVLKLGGSDIEAVMLAGYGPDSMNPRLAAVGSGWYAVCRNDLNEILAFVKKKGFKPKIMPPLAHNKHNDMNEEAFDV